MSVQKWKLDFTVDLSFTTISFKKNMDFSQTNLPPETQTLLKKGISELKAKEKERAAYEAAEKLESMATCILIVTCGFEALYAVALYVFAQNPTRYEYRSYHSLTSSNLYEIHLYRRMLRNS
mgnify:CR=1 FL=1